jgi:tetratricopeptide (TPR) repeat protein
MLRLLFVALLCCQVVATELSEQTITTWAAQIEEGFAQGDGGEALAASFSQRRIGEMALTPLSLPAAKKKNAIAGFANTRKDAQMPARIAEGIEGGGSYHLLRIHRTTDGWSALFRLLQSNGSCNYHDLMLEDSGVGKPQVYDMYIFAAGERLSETVRNIFIPILSLEDPGILQRLFGVEKESIKYVGETLSKLPKLQSNGRHEEVVQAIESLPPAIKSTKAMQVQRIMATQHLNEELYSVAMEEYAKSFPQDPSLHLINIDRYLLAKRIDDCINSIDKLEAALGTHDAWLNALRASVYLQSDKLTEAQQQIKQALEGEPALQQAWWIGVSIALTSKDYDTVVIYLQKIERLFNIEFSDLTTLPDYADFVKTPQYQQWLSRSKSQEKW